jgi:bifunctional non-homologous end joining protein LigD
MARELAPVARHPRPEGARAHPSHEGSDSWTDTACLATCPVNRGESREGYLGSPFLPARQDAGRHQAISEARPAPDSGLASERRLGRPYRPDWIKTAPTRSKRRRIDYCVINDLPALVWAANLANLELHTFLDRVPEIERPTMLAFDLDPGEGVDIIACCQVGLWIQKILQHLSIECFPKTSGSKGLQLYVPLNTVTDYQQTKAFAHALAERMQREHPRQVVSKMLKNLRVRKVLVDWSQNDAHKTTVCVYSLRARNRPAVSTPLTWDEVASALRRRTPPVFGPHDVLVRIKKSGDLFEPVLKLKQKLPTIESLNEANP